MDFQLSSNKPNLLDDNSNSIRKMDSTQAVNKSESSNEKISSGESDADSGIVAICSPVENTSNQPYSSTKSSYSNSENISINSILHKKSNSCSQLQSQPSTIFTQSNVNHAEQIDTQAILRQIYNQQFVLSQKLKASSDKLRLPEFILNHSSSTNSKINHFNHIQSFKNLNDYVNTAKHLDAINSSHGKSQLNTSYFINSINQINNLNSGKFSKHFLNSDEVIYENARVIKQDNDILVQQCINNNLPLHSIEYSIRPDNLITSTNLNIDKSFLNQYSVPVIENCEYENSKPKLNKKSSQILTSLQVTNIQNNNLSNTNETTNKINIIDNKGSIEQQKQLEKEDLKQALLEAIRHKNLERKMLEQKENEIKNNLKAKINSTSVKQMNTFTGENFLNKINNNNYFNLDPLESNESMINAFASVALIDDLPNEQNENKNFVETWIDDVDCLPKPSLKDSHLFLIRNPNLNIYNHKTNFSLSNLNNCKTNSILKTVNSLKCESNYQNLDVNPKIEIKNEIKLDKQLNSKTNLTSSIESSSEFNNKMNFNKEKNLLTQSCMIANNLDEKSDLEDDLITKSYNGGYCSKETKKVLDEINLQTKTFHKSFLHKFSHSFTKAISKAFHLNNGKQVTKDVNTQNSHENNVKLNLDDYCILRKPSLTEIQKDVILLKRSNDKKHSITSNNTSSHRKLHSLSSIKKRNSIHKKLNGISPSNSRLNSQSLNNRRFSQSNLIESNLKNNILEKSLSSTFSIQKSNSKSRIRNEKNLKAQTKTKRLSEEIKNSKTNINQCKHQISTVNSLLENNVTGELVELNVDGSQVIELKRQAGQHFGFFVARGKVKNVNGVYVSRMKDENTQNMLSGLLEIGDEIIAINDVNVKNASIIEVNYLMTKKNCIKLHVMPYISSKR